LRAIILAAGFGTRLLPLTSTVPKCLVLIKGRPLLDIWLERLTSAEIDRILINTHYLSEKVQSYVNKSIYKGRLVLAHEEKLCGTAGTLINNIAFFEEEDGLLIHADNYCLADMKELIRHHNQRPKECVMTMMTFRTDRPSSCGIIELNERGVVVAFHEKKEKPPGNLANAAIYILSKELIRIIIEEMKDAKDFSTEVIPKLLGRIYSYETPDLLVDIGTPESYKKANI